MDNISIISDHHQDPGGYFLSLMLVRLHRHRCFLSSLYQYLLLCFNINICILHCFHTKSAYFVASISITVYFDASISISTLLRQFRCVVLQYKNLLESLNINIFFIASISCDLFVFISRHWPSGSTNLIFRAVTSPLVLINQFLLRRPQLVPLFHFCLLGKYNIF